MNTNNNEEKPLVISDSPELKNIFIQINTKENTTAVLSNFSAWENLAHLMEALAVTIEKCVKDGISRKEVHQEIVRYMTQVIGAYNLKK